jgi:hypothetical protein
MICCLRGGTKALAVLRKTKLGKQAGFLSAYFARIVPFDQGAKTHRFWRPFFLHFFGRSKEMKALFYIATETDAHVAHAGHFNANCYLPDPGNSLYFH